MTNPEHICISTDDPKIIQISEELGVPVPFVRPAELATDTASTNDVILHAIDFYAQKGIFYEIVVLLQPTSPFRLQQHIQEALALFEPEIDMLVSVFETKSNPYYVLFEEQADGWLQKSKTGQFTRRQDVPKVYELNGSIYVINVAALKKYGSMAKFTKLKKYIMEPIYSIDLDTPLDWLIAENVFTYIRQQES